MIRTAITHSNCGGPTSRDRLAVFVTSRTTESHTMKPAYNEHGIEEAANFMASQLRELLDWRNTEVPEGVGKGWASKRARPMRTSPMPST
jgi:hypothetical protein